MAKKVFKFISILISFVVFVISCSSPSSGGSNSSNINSGIVAQGTGTVGQEGGIVKAGSQLTITIPEGALSENVQISAKYIDSINKIHSTRVALPVGDFLCMAEFGPSGTEFAVPVDVSIQLNSFTSSSKVSIYCYDEIDDKWIFVSDADVSGTTATFKVNHFSKYAAVDLTPEMMSTFNTICKNGLQNGKSDQQIIDEFRNYLINDCKLMEKFTRYEGFYYKPVTLNVGGDYHYDDKENKATLSSSYGKEISESYKGLVSAASSLSSNSFQKNVNDSKLPDSETAHDFISNVYAVIYYEMIEPEIVMTAGDTELSPGETTIVNLTCHYNNLELDGYNLTLSVNNPDILEVSKTKIVTDSNGKASFSVKCKDTGTAKVTAKFSELDCEGQAIASQNDCEFICETSGWHLEAVIDFDVRNTYAPYIGLYESVIEQNCTDHTFKTQAIIQANFKLVEKTENGQKVLVPEGKASVKCNDYKTSWSLKKDSVSIKTSFPGLDPYVTDYVNTYAFEYSIKDCKNIPISGIYDSKKGLKLLIQPETIESWILKGRVDIEESVNGVVQTERDDIFLYASCLFDIDLIEGEQSVTGADYGEDDDIYSKWYSTPRVFMPADGLELYEFPHLDPDQIDLESGSNNARTKGTVTLTKN